MDRVHIACGKVYPVGGGYLSPFNTGNVANHRRAVGLGPLRGVTGRLWHRRGVAGGAQ